MNDNIDEVMDEQTEQQTEEQTEQQTEQQTEEETEQQTEEQTEQQTEEERVTLTREQFDELLGRSANDGITFYGYTDHTPYLSVDVDGATINDVYTMLLSTRNILLLFFLFWICLKLANMLKSILYRVYNK